MKQLTILILFLFCCATSGIEPDKLKNLYDSGSYQDILSITSDLHSVPEKDPEGALYRGLALYRQNKFKESVKYLSALSRKTDNQRIKETALYFTALSKINLNLETEAALMLTALLNSSFSDLAENSAKVLEAVINFRMTEDDFKILRESSNDKYLSKLIDLSGNSLKILAVLPLTGVDKEAGKQLLSGLEYAVKKLNLKGKKIKLDVVNSEGKMPLMIKKVLEKINSTRYNLVIGELRSDATAALAGITTQKKIPLISPTASDNNLSGISSSVFQLNTTSYTLSNMLAGFSIDSLECRTFAILAPATDDGIESVEGFTEKVKEKGCSVISTEWYFDPYDLKKQLTRLRERLLEISSLDVNEYMTEDSISAYSAGIADAVFLPVPNSDIEPVISQIAYYNFKGRLLGTYGWNDISMLNKVSMNADSLVYIKESSYDPDDVRLNDFINEFRQHNSRNPKDLEITGYSLIEMLVSIQNNNPAGSVVENLSELKEYSGINGQIHFKDNKTNYASDVYMYSARKKKTERISYSEESGTSIFTTAEKYYNLAYVNEIFSMYDKAVENYSISLDEFESLKGFTDSLAQNCRIYPEIFKRLGSACLMIKDYKKAEKYLSLYLDHNPKDREAVYKNAAAGSNLNPDKYLEVLLRFSDDKEYGREANLAIGNIYSSLADSLKAAEYYKKAEAVVSKKNESKKSSSNVKRNSKNKLNIDW
jgi:branched-chain amino acid transport system substrate-binding protein